MNPVLVNAWRGNTIESRYRGTVAVVDSSARVIDSYGDIQRPVFPRSAIKFLQAIPFVESGAVDAFGLDRRHIALACASHNGEPAHVDLAREWLDRIGCTHDDLECGAELPIHKETQFELMQSGQGPERLHNNCSGKHLGLLSTCRHLGERCRNYRLYSHPAQRRLFDVLESMGNARVTQLGWGYDGCGIPTIAMPPQRIALAMARFADVRQASDQRRSAIEQIQAAIAAEPYMLAGKDRLCTALMQRLAPKVLVKVGAEGVYTAALPEEGVGVALKIDDGNDAAARVALGAVLHSLGALDGDDLAALEEFVSPSLTNSRGEVTGRLEISSEWAVA